jgi:predicted NBD/HSP70 family sugar kinase
MDDHFELFAPMVREQIARAKLTPASHITVAKAALGNDAGMIGAARLPLMQPTGNRKLERKTIELLASLIPKH